MATKNPLLDEVFLQKLYLNRHKEIYAKIIALNLKEEPVEQIEGQVTGGSVSLDGSSNVRRSCNLTMIAQDVNINAYYWGFKNKFKLFIGLNNYIDNTYDDIIWFPFGTMVITNFSTSLSTNGYNISISGKDKMCLLNGELSGSLFASVDFGTEEYYDATTNVTTKTSIPIKRIIREAVHEYAQEPWENIIINDLDDYGLELLDYKGSLPLYLIIDEARGGNEDLGDVVQITLDGNIQLYKNSTTKVKLSQINKYNPRSSLNFENASIGQYDYFSWDGSANTFNLSVAKVEYGQTCGYRYTDITYAGDLILGVGEPITSMLDKLVAMLGNWEYFYDTDGRFIFQRKKTYLDKTWNNIITTNDDSYIPTIDETYVESSMWSSAVSWNFTDSFLVTAFNNTPVLNNVRNDYSIWGTKQSINGTELPVHLRYGIDTKPKYYHTLEDSRERYQYRSEKIFITKEYYAELQDNPTFRDTIITQSMLRDGQERKKLKEVHIDETNGTQVSSAISTPSNLVLCDWRELIFQMALDARQHGHDDDFLLQVRNANGLNEDGDWRYPDGRTGYEQYYTDLEGFWRQLYCPPKFLSDWYNTGVWTDREAEYFMRKQGDGYALGVELSEAEKTNILYFLSTNYVSEGDIEGSGWNTEVIDSPATINFWFDFLDPDTETDFAKYSVPAIGDRAKSVNDDMVKAIYFREIPTTIFVQDLSTAQRKAGYTYMQYQPAMERLFTMSSQGKCAIDVLEEWLNNYVYAIESVSLTTIPIYHLLPNTIIQVTDIESNINGNYIVSRISIPLTYNGTMSITATKIADRVY